MFLIHYLQMPGHHRWVMWHQTHAWESHVECSSEQWRAKAVVLGRLCSCLSKRLPSSRHLIQVELLRRQDRTWKRIYTCSENSSLVVVFQKAEFDVNILSPSSCLSLWTQSPCPHWRAVPQEEVEGGRHCDFITNWGDLPGSTFAKSHLPWTW